MLRSSVILVCVLGCLCAASERAFADIYYGADAETYTYIGTGTYWGLEGTLIVQVKPRTDECAVTAVLGSAEGPYADWDFQMGNYDDAVIFIEGDEEFGVCGITLRKFNFNGYHINVYGNGGNDQLHGGEGDTWLYGGEGHDLLFAAHNIGAILHGGPGNDLLLSSEGVTQEGYFGDEGDDFICEHSFDDQQAHDIDGGDGDDTRNHGSWCVGGPRSVEHVVDNCPVAGDWVAAQP